MASLTIDLPDSISESEAKLLLALKLYEEGRVSCGKAAEIAGHSKRTFIELLGKHGIPVVNYPAEEVEKDLENA